MRLVLPTIIQNRRIFFLDMTKLSIEGKENFVIDISQDSDIVPLITIVNSRKLQSLVDGEADIQLQDLEMNMSMENGTIQLRLSNLQESESADTGLEEEKDWKTESDDTTVASEEVTERKSLPLKGGTLHLRRASQNLELFLSIEEASQLVENYGSFDIEISYTLAGTTYTGIIQTTLALASNFVHSVLDFGSEASQIKHKYTRKSMNVETTESSTENLFLLLKNYQNENEKAEDYLQYSVSDNYLKSIFYIKDKIGEYNPIGDNFFVPTEENQLKMLCTRNEISTVDFNKSYLQLPNLKLAHRHGSNLSNLMFGYTYGGLERMVEFEHLKEQIYATLLREMSMAYLHNPMLPKEGLYLRYSILIPNIYDHADLLKTKNIINRILQEAQKDEAMPKIKAWEVQTISESDASFLGYYNSATNFTEPDKHYIVIDCGKGTTDFSILRTDPTNSREVSPVYRNGFAGAGNLVSYGYFQSMLNFLISEAKNRTQAKNFYEQMIENLSDNQRQTLFEIIEKWKFSYNKSFTEAEISSSWRGVQDGDINITNLYEQTDNDYNRVLLFLSKLRVCYDWGGYISEAVKYIANNIALNIETVISRIEDKAVAIESVLFTGRAFLYPPLYQAVVSSLDSIGISEVKIEKLLSAEKLKSVCLDGVIQDGNIIHPEMIGIPIQVELKSEVTEDEFMPTPKKNLMETIRRMATKFVDGSGNFDSSQNELLVKTDNLKYTRFMMSNSFFSFAHPFFSDNENYDSVDFIFTNSGFYFRAKDKLGKILLTSKLGEAEEFTSVDKAHVVASLFPATIDPQIIKPFQEDFSTAQEDDFNSFLPKS